MHDRIAINFSLKNLAMRYKNWDTKQESIENFLEKYLAKLFYNSIIKIRV